LFITGKCWQIFARVDERRRDGRFRRLLIDAGELEPDTDVPEDALEDALEAVESVMASLVDGCVDEDPIPDPYSFRRVRLFYFNHHTGNLTDVVFIYS
jgi:hypothetical protein